MQTPTARGTLSSLVLDALWQPAGTVAMSWVAPDDPEDEQLALWVLQELSFRRMEGVDPRWEEDASFLAVRARLERRLEEELREVVAPGSCQPGEVPAALAELVARADGPSVSRWVEQRGTLDHLREFAVHRAAYQLQEADPHSFAIPRLEASPAKTALLQLQLDEYGGHEPSLAHATLFAETMEALGLRPEPDLDRLPAATLATNTLLGWLGRSRRLLPACLGHLAAFEMTSVEPMARYAAAVRRLLPGPAATAGARFYDVHVAADALHGEVALDRMVAPFVADHPDEAAEILFGAAAVLHVEGRFARHLVDAWDRGTTSLRSPLPGARLCSAPVLAVAS